MATLMKLYGQLEKMKEQYFIRNRIAEENRKRDNQAAVKIQSWFRGCQVRAYLSHLHKNATVIQRIWRGFIARKLFRHRVKAAYFIMKIHFYNKMAVKIQKRWRGYYIRKYVHNYYARKRYLQALTRKNNQIRRDLEEFAELQKRERERIALEKEEREKNLQAQRLHFLLSTKQCPGVYNSPFRMEPDEMELRLRQVKPQSAPKERKTPKMTPDLFNLMPNRERLPPIQQKPQGPFRPALEVQQQRHRPLEPSVRVATSITALEEAREELKRHEWRTRVIDQTPLLHSPFQWPPRMLSLGIGLHCQKIPWWYAESLTLVLDNTFLSTFKPNPKQDVYEGLMHTSTPFEQAAYGTKHFREEHKELLQGKKPFKTIFTSCHVFDKFGRLYSNAGNIV